MTSTYFITGAEGTGKTSIIPLLKKKLPKIDFHDFDEVGVPENPLLQWRLDATLHWIKESRNNRKKSVSTAIVGLSFPNEVEKFKEEKKIGEISFLLLDVKEEEREKRLKKRKSTTQLIKDLRQLHQLREEIKNTKYGTKILDTSDLSIEEVANKVIDWIKISKN